MTAASSSPGRAPGLRWILSSPSPSFHKGRIHAWSGATRNIKNSLGSMAPMTFAAFALPGFRSVCIWPNTDDARSSASFVQGHPLLNWGASVGKAKHGWARLASIMTHLARILSALFPVLEIELALPDAMKLAHPKMYPSLTQRKKKWRSSATDGITPTYASQ